VYVVENITLAFKKEGVDAKYQKDDASTTG
jgi:hypothetical protein